MTESCEGATKRLTDWLDSIEIVRLFRSGSLDVDGVLKRLSELEDDDPLLQVKPDGRSLLAQFSILGSYEIVEKLWQRGLRPAENKTGSCTLIHCAVHVFPHDSPNKLDLDRSKILRLLFSAGEDYANCLPVNQQNSWGWTPLKIAVRQKLEKCTEILLEQGADTLVTDEQGYSPLHNALGDHVIVKMLLRASSRNIDAQNSDGDTALSLGLKKGDLESCMVLLEHGANPNISNKEGITPLFLAAKMGHLELVKALVKYSSVVNAGGGEQGLTALHWAAHKEMREVALYLIEKGGDVTAGDKVGRTPLSMASPELAEQMKAAAQRHTPTLCTSPHACAMTAQQKAVDACCSGNITALEALLHAGVGINHASGETQATLVHMAAYYGQLKVLMYLYHHGANINAVDKDGDTVLHFACMKDFPQGMYMPMIKMLVSGMFSNPNPQNLVGDTPVMTALKHGYVCRALLLLHVKADANLANSKGELPIHRASENIQNIEVLFHLVDVCADINVRDKKGLTPLAHAVKSNCSSAVKYLLQRGAEPNVRDEDGNTPLYVAVQENNINICYTLLFGGADPNAPSERNITPCHIAMQKCNIPLCKVLMMFNADLTAKDSDGNTPFSLAPPHFREAMRLGQNLKNELVKQLKLDSREEATPSNAPGPVNDAPGSLPDNECLLSAAFCNDTCRGPLAEGQRSTCENGRSAESGQSANERPICNGDIPHHREEGATERGVASEEGVAEKAKKLLRYGKARSLEKQDTLSKEGSVEEEGEEGELSCERLLEMCTELTSTVTQLQDDLEALTHTNQLLLSKNKSLEEAMKANERKTVQHHLHQALSLSVHALCHGMMYSDFRLRNNTSRSVSEDAAGKLPSRHSPPTVSRNSSSPSLSLERKEVGGKGEGLLTGGECAEEMLPKYNPLKSGYLQWWMVDKGAIQYEGAAINTSSPPEGRFFDVHLGTFRHAPVVVRTIRNISKWKYESFLSFFTEVNLLSCLHCPHLVQFMGACFDPASKNLWIVNEHMSHGSLHSVLHEKELPLEWKTRTSIMQDVAHGMVFLHSLEILHCNLTPRNILIGEHFNAKLNDFDFYQTKLKCGFIDELKSNSPAPGGYIAPEALPNFEFTQASDVYSFGVVMYECGTGKVLLNLADLQLNAVALVMRLVMKGFPEDVAPGYRALSAKCCNTDDPSKRPNFESVITELTEVTDMA